jgi:hypothetical protein
MGYMGKIRAPLRPGLTVNLAQQEFALALSCKSWLAWFPYIKVMNKTASQGDDERNNRAAISFAAVVLRDNYPEMTEDLVAEALDLADLRAFYEAVRRAEEQRVPLIASSEGISIPWLAGESRLVTTAGEGGLRNVPSPDRADHRTPRNGGGSRYSDASAHDDGAPLRRHDPSGAGRRPHRSGIAEANGHCSFKRQPSLSGPISVRQTEHGQETALQGLPSLRCSHFVPDSLRGPEGLIAAR